ncbi:MAG TPA: OsmC family protein [Bryobacteraceae bacterium]|nr:OsmC family protein [Bryobacteraceae bacterium]
MSEMKIQISQISACTSETILGPHRVLIDRPVEKGGTAQGPMGGELFLASVGGCFISNILAAIRSRNEPVSNVRVQVTGTLTDSPPVRYSAIQLTVNADTPDRSALQHIVEIADRGCSMLNTLRGTLDLRVHIAADSNVLASA